MTWGDYLSYRARAESAEEERDLLCGAWATVLYAADRYEEEKCDAHHVYETIENVRATVSEVLASAKDEKCADPHGGELSDEALERIVADMRCGHMKENLPEAVCARRMGHEGRHAGMDLEGVPWEWVR